MDPQNGLAAIGKAYSLLELERYQEAEFALNTALRLNPEWQEGRQLQEQLTDLLRPWPPVPTTSQQTYSSGWSGDWFVCHNCGYEWEETYEDAPEDDYDWYPWCPECGSDDVEGP